MELPGKHAGGVGGGGGLGVPIAIAMAGVDLGAAGLADAPSDGERVRALIAWLAKGGARAVRIDATMAGIRPRELGRSGRRDLGSLLRRGELALAGLDVFVPPAHLIRPETADRAMSSILAAIDLAAELGTLAGSPGPRSVSLMLDAKTPPDVRAAIGDHAAARGVRIADQAWPIAPGPEDAAIGIGLDPAAALATNEDPVMLAARLGKRLACARLSDVARDGIGRTIPGEGRLELEAYLATLATIGYPGFAVLDLRGLRDPARAVRDIAGSGRA